MRDAGRDRDENVSRASFVRIGYLAPVLRLLGGEPQGIVPVAAAVGPDAGHLLQGISGELSQDAGTDTLFGARPEGAPAHIAGEYEALSEDTAVSELEGPVTGAVHLLEDVFKSPESEGPGDLLEYLVDV